MSEGDQIPWDVFFYRGPVIRNITKNGVTRVERVMPPRTPGVPSPLYYEASSEDFWETELMALVKKTNSVIYPVPGGMRIWGDGVRLHLPLMWIYDTPAEDVVLHIIQGINVSLQNRQVLGY